MFDAMKRWLIGLLCVCALAICACVAAPDEGGRSPDDSGAEPANEQHGAESQGADMDATPLKLTRLEYPYGGGFIILPYIVEESHSDLNATLLSHVKAALDDMDAPKYTYYRIKYNSNALFSLLIYISDIRTDEISLLLPVTIDVSTGRMLSMADCLSGENDRWRGVIPDIISLQAKSREMTLLNEIMPISDSQAFYITGDALVLVYRPYEIATFDAGSPEFEIPIEQLSEFIESDSPLARLKEAVRPSILKSEEGAASK